MEFGRVPGAVRILAAVAVLTVPAVALTQDAPPPAPKPYVEVVKLWKGNLSEDFIRRKIERESIVYELSADDIVSCKAAGVPESIIEAMLSSAARPAAVPPVVASPAAPAPVAPAPAPAQVPMPAPMPPPSAPPPAPPASAPDLAALADRSWDGIVRRNEGVALFKSRWDEGRLTFKDRTLTWLDADEAGKNLTVAGKEVKEQFLVCMEGSQARPECFEWGVKTAGAEYRFRDVSWQGSPSTKPQELFDFFEAIYPDLASARYPAKKK